MRSLIGLLMCLLLATAVGASEPYTLGSDGHYYGADGLRYTRTVSQVWVPGYWYWKGCCRYWQAGYYKTSYTYTKVLSAATPGWRNELIKLAAARDQIEGKMRYAQYEQTAFIESVKELGLSGNFFMPGYGQLYGVNPHLGPHGASGTTVYSSYTNSSAADIYGAVDRAVLFQQASAHVNNAGALFGQGVTGFQQMVTKEGERAAFVAEIIAKGQAAAQALSAANPTPSVHTRQQSTTVEPSRLQSPRWLAAANQCISCHGDTNPEGGYEVMKHWTLPAERQKEVVYKHLLADENSEGFMPRRQDGTPGKRLPAELILEFLPPSQRPGGR